MGLREDFFKLDVIDEEGRRRVPRPDVIDLAITILDLYKKGVDRFVHGRPPFVGKKHYKHFYRAGEMCKEMQMSPATFTRMQLEGMARTGKFWPSAIASGVHAELSGTSNSSISVQFTRLYRSMLTLYEQHSRLYGVYQTLSDASIQFTPLFRAALAKSYGFDDIVEKYIDAAREELEAVPVAREVFANLGLEF